MHWFLHADARAIGGVISIEATGFLSLEGASVSQACTVLVLAVWLLAGSMFVLSHGSIVSTPVDKLTFCSCPDWFSHRIFGFELGLRIDTA